MSEKIDLYNVQDGIKGRDGGPYLDQIERHTAEVRRAAQEDREPAGAWEKLPPAVGTVIVTARQLEDNSYTSNPSMAGVPGVEAADFSKVDGLADPIDSVPAGAFDEPDEDDGQDELDFGQDEKPKPAAKPADKKVDNK